MKKKQIFRWAGLGIVLLLTHILAILEPTAFIYGIQQAGVYAAIALPMALILGIVHIVNLAHGEMMMLGAYITYYISVSSGMDPLLAAIPTGIIMFLFGLAVYQFTIRYTLKAPELNQLILTFGIAMVISQSVNLFATSQPRKLSLDYVSSSANIRDMTFGTYSFIFPVLAIVFLGFLILFLKRTRIGKAAMAVGQNPKGAKIVGINVGLIYALIFAIASMLVGIYGSFFLTKFSIFPSVGGSYTMKSFCLVAMAGIGNLPMVALSSLVLGLSERAIMTVPHGSGWADMIFFVLIIFVIFSRSIRRKG